MRIAIVRLSALGDIIQSMIVLQFIKKQFPNAEIHWYVDDRFSQILHDNEDINQVISLNITNIKRKKSVIGFFKMLISLRNQEKYDLAIDLQGLVKSAVITRFIPALRRFGFDKYSSRESFSSHFYSDLYRISYENNVIMRYISLVNFALGFKTSENEIRNKKPLLNLEKKNTKKKPKILVIPGASFPSKIYSEENYAKVINYLKIDSEVIWNSEKERLMAIKIKKLSPNVQITQSKNLSDLKQIILRSDLVIGGDTGPTHLAWALNIASITIFGSTPQYRNSFGTEINHSVASDNEINVYKINKYCDNINNIDPKKIADISDRILNNDL